MDILWHQPYESSEEFETARSAFQDLLDGGSDGGGGDNDDGALKCNPIDNNKWAFEADFDDAINTVCNEAWYLNGYPGQTKESDFRDSKAVKLTINYPKDKPEDGFANWFIPSVLCRDGFRASSIEGCAENDNPGSLKHGGSWTDNNGIEFITEPLKDLAVKTYCNLWTGDKHNAFISKAKMEEDKIKFCADVAGWSSNKDFPDFHEVTYDAETDNSVRFKVSLRKPRAFSQTSCNKDLEELHIVCNEDAILNQFDFKWGGLVARKGIYYEVTPLKSRRPIMSGGGEDPEGFTKFEDRSRGDTGKDGHKIDKAVLQMCLAGYGEQQWDGLPCGGESAKSLPLFVAIYCVFFSLVQRTLWKHGVP